MTTVETEGTTTLQKGFVGQNVSRREDKRLVQGEGVFFDDVKRHGMGYVHFLRSPYAHARITSIDVSAALALPGVHGTLTGDEVAILTDPFFQIAAEPGANVKDFALAVGKVRYVGEPVVAVVAETREHLGGYFLIEAADRDEAVRIAQRIPGARYGTVEVRPVLEIPNLP